MASITYNTGRKSVTHIIRATNGGTTFTNVTPGQAFDYFDDSPQVNDAVYFLVSTGGYSQCAGIELDVATPIQGTDVVLKWEYYAYWAGGQWLEIPNVEDPTNGLTITGTDQLIYWPYPPFSGHTTVNGIRGNIIVRVRLDSFTSITEGGANAAAVPQFADGVIRINDYTEASPATLEDVYNYMSVNYPNVGMTYLDENKKVWILPHASISTANGWLKMSREYLKIGNGSEGSNNSNWTIVNLSNFIAGTKVGDDKFKDPCTLAFCNHIGSGWLTTSANTKMYGVHIVAGTYKKTIGGTTYSHTGWAYTNLSYGEYIGVAIDLAGTGYWNGAGLTMKNCFFRSTFNVTFPFGAGQTFENVSVFNEGTVNGLMGLYGSAGDGELEGFSWSLGGGYLFKVQSNLSVQCNYNFLNPSPAFPELTDSPGYMYTDGGYPLNTNWNVYERYTLDLRVIDENGNPIEGATVTCIDDYDGSTAFTATTDANGEMLQQKLLRSHGYSDGSQVIKENHETYTVTISKSGYLTKRIKYTMDRKREEIEVLEKRREV